MTNRKSSARPSLGDVMGKKPDTQLKSETTVAKAVSPPNEPSRKPGKRSLGWVQLNVHVPEALRTQAKIKALQEGEDLSDVVTTLLQTWVSKP